LMQCIISLNSLVVSWDVAPYKVAVRPLLGGGAGYSETLVRSDVLRGVHMLLRH
jgi:hypothetical protein